MYRVVCTVSVSRVCACIVCACIVCVIHRVPERAPACVCVSHFSRCVRHANWGLVLLALSTPLAFITLLCVASHGTDTSPAKPQADPKAADLPLAESSRLIGHDDL